MRIMAKLVCQFCRAEIDNKGNVIDPNGKLAQKSVCVNCLMQYIAQFQHLKNWNDEKTDPRHHDYGLEIG
tara:strand:+ start:325 stop:534 length:210 start_codon:yes stop_codon:yes gene_type:complete